MTAPVRRNNSSNDVISAEVVASLKRIRALITVNPMAGLFIVAVLMLIFIDLVLDVFEAPGDPCLLQHFTAHHVASSPPTDSFCVPWDYADFDEWWIRHPEYSLGKENDTHQCLQRELNLTKLSIYTRIYSQQWASEDCPSVQTYNLEGWGQDFFALENLMLNAMNTDGTAVVLSKESTHVWPFDSTLADTKSCGAGDLRCYFLPMSNCEPDYAENNTITLDPPEHNRDLAPDVYDFMTRPQQWLRHSVYDKVQSYSLEDDCIVLDVRRSADTNEEGNNFHLVSDYLDELTEDQKRGPQFVMVTDDFTAIDEAKELHPNHEWRFVDLRQNNDQVDQIVYLYSTPRIVKPCSTMVTAEGDTSHFAEIMARHMRPGTEVHHVKEEGNLQSKEALETKREELRKERKESEGRRSRRLGTK